jgi:adenylate cyclase
MTFCPEPDPKDGLLAALCELGSEARTPAEFVAAIGENLGRSALKVERIFVGLQTNHPEFRARTYVWERSWSDVRTVEWPHGLANRPGYFDSPSQHVHTTRREYRVRVFAEAAKRPCDVCAELHAGGHNDYLMPPGPRLTNLTPIGIRWEEQDGTQI